MIQSMETKHQNGFTQKCDETTSVNIRKLHRLQFSQKEFQFLHFCLDYKIKNEEERRSVDQ